MLICHNHTKIHQYNRDLKQPQLVWVVEKRIHPFCNEERFGILSAKFEFHGDGSVITKIRRATNRSENEHGE